jgi:hypothetical protein
MQKKHFYAQLQDQVLENLLFVEKFRKDEFSFSLGFAAQTLSLTRRELKPVYQKFKNNCKLSDGELKARGEQIERDFEKHFAEDLAQAMAGGSNNE